MLFYNKKSCMAYIVEKLSMNSKVNDYVGI